MAAALSAARSTCSRVGINLSGGEPTARRDIVEITAAAQLPTYTSGGSGDAKTDRPVAPKPERAGLVG
jgi:hypothetical protein